MSDTVGTSNPWEDLPDAPPYVYGADAEPLAQFNRTADDLHKYHLDILPEPFLGRPAANVVLMNLNPGYSGEDEKFHHLDDYFRQVALANLAHREREYPFYFLDPRKKSPGHIWWQRRLRELTDLFGNRLVSRNVLCLEYFPYHSEEFDVATPPVPSQAYNFTLLRDALARDATIIVMRAERQWATAVPELSGKSRYVLNSNQSVYVSRKNCPTGFEAACDRLRAAARAPSPSL